MVDSSPPEGFHGRIVKSLEVSGFILTEAVHNAGSRLPRHAHANPYFCFVLQGAYTEKCGSQEVVCKPSTLTFRESGELHEAHLHDADARVFMLELSPPWTERLRQESLSVNSSSDLSGSALALLSARLNREFHRTDGAACLALEGIALELLAEAVRKPSIGVRPTPPWLVQARDLITAHFAERLTLTSVAEHVGVHPVHLATSFRERFGVTIGEYVRGLRIDFARAELRKQGVPLAEIALHAGFADQSHFSKVFRAHVGTTPAKYRRSVLDS